MTPQFHDKSKTDCLAAVRRADHKRDMDHLISFGHGYVARRLSDHLRPLGWNVTGTARSAERAAELTTRGERAVIWPGAEPDLTGATHVLISVPPDADGCPVARRFAGGLRAAGVRWVGYLSTTGVYGDHVGDWVDEGSACRPTHDRAARRLRAEEDWQATGLPVHVFRLSGIYGPGRSVFDQLRAGRARRIDKPGQLFSRIHVDDICAVLAASMAAPLPGLWNLADDLPSHAHEVVTEAARLLGIVPPPIVPFEDAGLSQAAREFYSSSRRVGNARMKADFGIALRYSTYREGLRAILAKDA